MTDSPAAVGAEPELRRAAERVRDARQDRRDVRAGEALVAGEASDTAARRVAHVEGDVVTFA